LLKFYNGGELSQKRRGKSIYAQRTSISITGAIQPIVLQQYLSPEGNSAGDGFWARFWFVELPTRRMPRPLFRRQPDRLEPLLSRLYQRIETQPAQVVKLCAKSEQIWQQWHEEIEDLLEAEASEGMRAILLKSRERAARIALVCQAIHSAFADQNLPEVLSPDLLAAAIAFVRWTIGQASLIFAYAGASESEESPLVLKFFNRFQGSVVDWKTVRVFLPKVRVREKGRDPRWLRQNKSECLNFMRLVEASGLGTIEEDKIYLESGDPVPGSVPEPASELVSEPVSEQVSEPVSEPEATGDSSETDTSLLSPEHRQFWRKFLGRFVSWGSDIFVLSRVEEDGLILDGAIRVRPEFLPEIKLVNSFAVGDLVEYSGDSLEESRVCGKRPLKIEEIEGDYAYCRAKGWKVRRKFHASDLRRFDNSPESSAGFL